MFLSRTAYAAATLLVLPIAPLQASGLRVMPVRLDVAPDKRHCALTVANDTVHPVAIQIRGYGWSIGSDGAERLDPDSGPVINPAIFSIAKGQSQLVRCSLPAAQGRTEGSWRLIIDELPNAAAAQPGTIRAVLRISIPVFRTPIKTQPALDWQLVDQGPGGKRMILRNTGSRHVRIAALDSRLAPFKSGQAALPAFGYLLAGSAWTLPVPKPPAAGWDALTITTDDGQTLIVQPARPGSPAS